MDAAGNLYIAATGYNLIMEWNVATDKLSTLVASGLECGEGVAVDGLGNVYIADTGDNAIKEWNASTENASAPTAPPWGLPDRLAWRWTRRATFTSPILGQQRDQGVEPGHSDYSPPWSP